MFMVHPKALRRTDQEAVNVGGDTDEGQAFVVECEVTDNTGDYGADTAYGEWIPIYLKFVQNRVADLMGRPFRFPGHTTVDQAMLGLIPDMHVRGLMVEFTNCHYTAFRRNLVHLPDHHRMTAQVIDDVCAGCDDEEDACDGDRCDRFLDILGDRMRDRITVDKMGLRYLFNKFTGRSGGVKAQGQPAILKLHPESLLVDAYPRVGSIVQIARHYLFEELFKYVGVHATVVSHEPYDGRGIPQVRLSHDGGERNWPVDMLSPPRVGIWPRTGSYSPDAPLVPKYPVARVGDRMRLRAWIGHDFNSRMHELVNCGTTGMVKEVVERNGVEYAKIHSDRGKYLWRVDHQTIQPRTTQHLWQQGDLFLPQRSLVRGHCPLSGDHMPFLNKPSVVTAVSPHSWLTTGEGDKRLNWDMVAALLVSPRITDMSRYEQSFAQGTEVKLCMPEPGKWKTLNNKQLEKMQDLCRVNGVGEMRDGLRMVRISNGPFGMTSWPARYLRPANGIPTSDNVTRSKHVYPRGSRILLCRHGWPGCEHVWSDEHERFVGLEATTTELSPDRRMFKSNISGELWWQGGVSNHPEDKYYVDGANPAFRPGGFAEGSRVLLGQHHHHGRMGTNWSNGMCQFIGMETRIDTCIYVQGIWVATVAVDGGRYHWRMRNMLPADWDIPVAKPLYKKGQAVRFDVSNSVNMDPRVFGMSGYASVITNAPVDKAGRFQGLYQVRKTGSKWVEEGYLLPVPINVAKEVKEVEVEVREAAQRPTPEKRVVRKSANQTIAEKLKARLEAADKREAPAPPLAVALDEAGGTDRADATITAMAALRFPPPPDEIAGWMEPDVDDDDLGDDEGD